MRVCKCVCVEYACVFSMCQSHTTFTSGTSTPKFTHLQAQVHTMHARVGHTHAYANAAKCDVNLRVRNGESALHWAAKRGHEETVCICMCMCTCGFCVCEYACACICIRIQIYHTRQQSAATRRRCACVCVYSIWDPIFFLFLFVCRN